MRICPHCGCRGYRYRFMPIENILRCPECEKAFNEEE